MSVAITNPCVLIDAAALARVVPGGRARLRGLLEAVGVERTATRPIHLAQRAFALMGMVDLAVSPTQVYSHLICSSVLVALLIEERRQADALRYSVTFPVGPTAHTADAFDAAVARVQARMGRLDFVAAGAHRHVTWQLVEQIDMTTATVDEVVRTIQLLLTFANPIGVALARVAFGDAPPECVEPVVDALFQKV